MPASNPIWAIETKTKTKNVKHQYTSPVGGKGRRNHKAGRGPPVRTEDHQEVATKNDGPHRAEPARCHPLTVLAFWGLEPDQPPNKEPPSAGLSKRSTPKPPLILGGGGGGSPPRVEACLGQARR